jgi:hypothetical protein
MDFLNKLSAESWFAAEVAAGCVAVAGGAAAGLALFPGVDVIAVGAAIVLATICGLESAGFGAQAAVASYMAVDPPDPHFKAIAVPSTVRVPTLKPGPRLSPASASAVNAVTKEMAQIAGLETALLAAMERAQGAADAHSRAWVEKQSAAAANLANLLSVSYRNLGVLLSNARRQLQGEHLPAPVLSAKEWGFVSKYVNVHGFPSSFIAQARAFGLGTQEIDRIRNSIVTAKPSSLTTSVVAVLGNPQLTKAINGAAQTFSSYAAGVKKKLAMYEMPGLSTNLLVNGCFSDPALGTPAKYSGSYIGVSPRSTGIPHWTVGAGGVQAVGTYWPKSPGCPGSLWLADDSPGFVSQSVPTTPGDRYLLRWEIGGHGEVESSNPLHVLWGGSTMAVQSGSTTTPWQPGQVTVTATQASTTLEFSASFSGGGDGPTIGSASLTQMSP